MRECQCDFDCEWLSEQFDDTLNEIGLGSNDVEIASWSLSYCQGDGVELGGRISPDDLMAVANVCAEADNKRTKKARREYLNMWLPERNVLWLADSLRQWGVDWTFRIHERGYCSCSLSIDGYGGAEQARDDPDLVRAAKSVFREEIDEAATELESGLTEWIRDLQRELAKLGYAEIEYWHDNHECPDADEDETEEDAMEIAA